MQASTSDHAVRRELVTGVDWSRVFVPGRNPRWQASDVVDAERELARVGEEIEGLEGRGRYIESHAELSTLTITIHEPVTVVGVAGPGLIPAAAEQSWQNLLWLLSFAIQSLGVMIPLAIAGLVGWVVVRRVRPSAGDA